MVDLPGFEPGCSIPFLLVSTSLSLLIRYIPVMLIYKLFGSVPAILLPWNSQSRWMTVIIYSENLYYNRSSLSSYECEAFACIEWIHYRSDCVLEALNNAVCFVVIYKDLLILLASNTSVIESNPEQAHKIC